MVRGFRHFLLALCLLLAASVQAGQATVAVAANFTATLQAIVTVFEKQSGHKVTIVSGSSGKFYAQIMHGAPFQAFFSADQQKPAALEKQGLTVAGSRFTYATGALALWSARAGVVDEQGNVLKHGRFNKLAMANAQLAPYGQAAVQVLQSLGLVDKTRHQWVRGENIAQTYQFVSTGNADLGFVALSQIIHNGQVKRGSAWIVPAGLYTPVRQDAVQLRSAKHSAAVTALLQFVRGPAAQALIKSRGYHTQSMQPG